MRATGVSRVVSRHRPILFVTAPALAVLVGLPAIAGALFPDFIPITGTPSGVAVDKSGHVYLSVRSEGRGLIWKYAPDGAATLIADVGQADVYGLFVTADRRLYVAMALGPDRGVYRVDRWGMVERLPGSEQIVYPNGFAVDSRGTLYVTESHSGAPGAYDQGGIWRIRSNGEAEIWLRHPLLTGIGLLGAPVGANGIAYYHGDMFVTNTDRGLVLRIAMGIDGSPGAPEVWKQIEEVPESPLAGSPFPLMPDGIAFDVYGNVYVTILTRNAVVRIDADSRVQESVAVLGSSDRPAPFDTPASLAFGTGAGEQQDLFVTNLGWMVRFIPGTWPGPALVKVPVGVPGRPLG